jgi:hypothetical protein
MAMESLPGGRNTIVQFKINIAIAGHKASQDFNGIVSGSSFNGVPLHLQLPPAFPVTFG